MKSRVVKIGNSQGIRIPKPLIEQAGIGTEVEITVSGNTLVIMSAHPPRSGWQAAFRAMQRAGDDRFLDAEVVETSRWDSEEWEW